ncbi:MAG: SIMPL domain-containing protein [bacterium]
MKNLNVFSSLILAAGVALAGWWIGWGFMHGRAAARFVTVKGVSERDVTADIALWPIQFVSTDDDLGSAQARIKTSKDAIMTFLGRHGFEPSEVEVQRLSVKDLYADPYKQGPIESRYIIEQTLMVRTTDCEKVEAAAQAVDEIIEAGVVLSAQGRQEGPTYLFTRLGDLKPEMIAEATAQARRAAEQFAADSGSQTGKIRQANQGVFVILARDRAPGISEAAQRHKTVRVVSTIEYFLKD